MKYFGYYYILNRNVFRINYSGAYNNNTKLCNACTENTTTNIVSAFDSIVLHGRPAGQYALQLHWGTMHASKS